MSGETQGTRSTQMLALETLDSAPFQIPQVIDERSVRELASSMQVRGTQQPILVRPKGERFEIVRGERTFRAAKLLGWTSICCRFVDLSDLDAEIANLIDYEGAGDAQPLERARAYAHLRDAFDLQQDEIARRIGVSKSVVSRTMALLNQPAAIQKLLAEERINPQHLRELEAVADESKRVELAAQVAEEGLSAREIARRVREAATSLSAAPSAQPIAKSAEGGSAKTSTEPSAAFGEPVSGKLTQQAIAEWLQSESAKLTDEAIADSIKSVIANLSTSIAKDTAQAPKAVTEHPALTPRRRDAIAAPRNSPRKWPYPFCDTFSGPWIVDIVWDPLGRLYRAMASWVVSDTLSGPWIVDIVWNPVGRLFRALTDRARLLRVGKAVLKFLARFIPGREPEPSAVSKVIRSYRELWAKPTDGEEDKPESRPPKAA